MKRQVPAVVLFVAVLVAACGRGEPPKLVAKGAATDEAKSITTVVVDETTTTTIAPPTTVPPPPTTVAPTTTTGAFSIREVSVSMNDCRHGFPPQGGAGSTYGCIGTFTARLNPGVGGTLTWTATWLAYGACDDPYQPSPWDTKGTLEVPTGASEVVGKLAIFSENDFNPRLVVGQLAKNTSHVQIALTGAATGKSPVTPFYGDGDCSVAGQYTSPSYGTAVEYP